MNNKLDKKKVSIIIHNLGLKYKLTDNDIRRLVESPYEFAANIIKKLDLSEIKKKEDLDIIKTNFLFTGFAKLYINFDNLYKRIQRNKESNVINIKKNKWKK